MGQPDLQVVESAPLPYLLSVPAARQAPPTPSPLLCFLHGYDEAAPLDIRQGVTRHGPLRPGSSVRAREDFIVVAPQLPRGGDIWHRHAEAVRTIVDEVRMAHHGDPKRMYLSGFSFGGNGVFDLALLQPDRWAALWPVDPTRVPRKDPERPVWLSIGEVARRNKARFIRALELESVTGEPESDRLYLDQERDHVGSATLAYQDDRIYTWLLSKQLPTPPSSST